MTSQPDDETAKDAQRKGESLRAANARQRYYEMGATRSIALLAEQMRQEQQATFAAQQAMGLTGKALTKVQTVPTIARRLKEWSRLFDWRGYCQERNREQALELQRQKTEIVQRMHDQYGDWGQLMVQRASQHMDMLLRLDTENLEDYKQRREVARQATQEALSNEDVVTAALIKWPERHKPYYTAHGLNELAALGLEISRLARADALEAAQRVQDTALPPVVEVQITTTPPSEPIDPLAEQLRAAPQHLPPGAQLPTALVALTTQPPSEPGDDDDDGWADEDD